MSGDDQKVDRIAVRRVRMRDESVVAGITHGRVEEAVHKDRPARLIQLVLDRFPAQRNLDNDVYLPGWIAADRHLLQVHGRSLYGRSGYAHATAIAAQCHSRNALCDMNKSVAKQRH